MSKETPSPWAVASDHCLATIRVATYMAETIKELKGLSVAEVSPLVSTLAPTLVVLPNRSDDKDEIRLLVKRVEDLCDTVEPQTLRAGEHWKVRLVGKGTPITIEVLTTIPHSQPEELDL